MANAGVYVFEKKIFDYIPVGKVSSLETDVFPKLISSGEELFSYFETDSYWSDIGSLVDFERVNDDMLANSLAVAGPHKV